MDSNCITNPISSNQVTDVDLLAPDCLGLCGNSLNDWLKAIANKMCECDYENFDINPIQDLLQQEPTELSQCVILNALVEAVETLKSELDRE